MFIAIGRAAARRALLPNKTAAPGLRLTTRLVRDSAGQANAALAPASARTLILSARLLSPTKTAAADSTSTGGKAKKTTAATTKNKSTTTKKKPAAKKKAAAKKKRVVKKKVAKKPKKKPAAKKPKKKLTPEEKEKAKLKELKKLALLKGPALLPESAWLVHSTQSVKTGEGPVTARIKVAAESFAKLSEAEKERLKSIAEKNHTINKETRDKWVNAYPPEAIYMANLARRRLARKFNKSRVFLLHDDRQPRRAVPAYAMFIKSRYAQVKDDSATGPDAFRSMSEEWKSLSDSDKQSFKDESVKDLEKQQAQFQKIREKAKAYLVAHKLSPSQIRLR
ncbi:hypothetical protein E4U43_008454 [Claviceps pusilla]|uniref:HMG box domain-containing protein n=1 Tax=Claviceps pusilla TaxID=123648 RepID=A0A9P7NAP6_9HYPO|nr:hypothetical protein E4U43_008454 [Claviceps pusilla]